MAGEGDDDDDFGEEILDRFSRIGESYHATCPSNSPQPLRKGFYMKDSQAWSTEEATFRKSEGNPQESLPCRLVFNITQSCAYAGLRSVLAELCYSNMCAVLYIPGKRSHDVSEQYAR